MGMDCITGPGIDISKLAEASKTGMDDVLFNTGFASKLDLSDLLDEDGDPVDSAYYDELLYEYTYEYLRDKHGMDCFSYCDDNRGNWFVLCEAKKVYDSGSSFEGGVKALRAEFGDDVPITWVEQVRW